MSNSGESEEKPEFQNTQEIIKHIQDVAAEKSDTFSSTTSFHWECAVSAEYYKDHYVKSRNRWSDAAYQGDWDMIFKIAAEIPAYMGRLANATRLLPAGAKIADSHPAGYTVLHQAAHYNAPEEVVDALITLGCLRQLQSTNGKADRPVDIALERGFIPLSKVLEPLPDLLPNISPAALERIQEHFGAVVKYEARGIFKPDSMRIADLGILREVKRIWMPVPGMYGGFNLRFEDDHLVTESFCRVMGGSGRTNHITAEGAVLVDQGWG